MLPAMAIRHGYDLYHPADTGPVIGWIYPPGSALAYLPATLINDPATALLAGRCLSLFYYYAPVTWLLLSRGGRSRAGRWLLLITFALLTCYSRPLRYASTEIHADAPALGLAVLAVGLMSRARGPRGQWAAIFLATLAVWAKQLTFPILAVVLPIWAYRKGGIRGFLQVFAATGIIAVGVLLAVMAWIDRKSLFFNILTIPIRHPWRFQSLRTFDVAIVRLQQSHLFLIALLAVGALAACVDAAWTEGDARAEPATSGDWTIFLTVSLAELPFALLAYVKVGGDDNNLAYFLYFVTITCVLLLARLLDREFRTAADHETAGGVGSPFVLVVLGVNLALAFVTHQMLGLALVSGETSDSETREAVSYLRKHPGEAYFPWNPLEHLMVDGKLYHFEYGVYDRDLGGRPLTEEHFRRHVPPGIRLVCYPPARHVVGERMTLRYMKEFGRPVKVPELPNWTCFGRVESDGGTTSAIDQRGF